jgi:hypothetical protein
MGATILHGVHHEAQKSTSTGTSDSSTSCLKLVSVTITGWGIGISWLAPRGRSPLILSEGRHGGQSADAGAFGEEVDGVPVPPDAGAGAVELLAGAGGADEPPPSVAGVAAAALGAAAAVVAERLSVL